MNCKGLRLSLKTIPTYDFYSRLISTHTLACSNTEYKHHNNLEYF